MITSVRVEDFCDLINGGTWSEDEYVDQGVPVVRVSDMKGGCIETANQKFISEKSFEHYAQHALKQFDLVIATVGSHPSQKSSAAGRATIIPPHAEGMLLNQNAVCIRTKSEDLDRRFLGFIGQSPQFQSYVTNFGRGAASQMRIPLSAIKAFSFSLPAKRTQKRVVDILSAYDDLIENNRKRIALLEEAARLLYREWFVHFRFPGHEHVKFIDGLPEGWERTSLDQVVESNSASYRAKELPEKINYIDISSVSKGRIVSTKSLSFNEAPGRARRKARHGDVIWSNVRPNLRAYALVLQPDEADVFSTGFTVLSGKNIPFSWLYLCVTTDYFVGHLINHATGVGYPAVRPDDFERAVVVVPSKKLLEHFHEAAEPIFQLVSKLEQQNQKLAQARDLLLPRLMNGEIPV